MSRKRLAVWGATLFLLWTPVLWTAAECYLAFKWKNLRTSNRYVRALPMKNFCPDLDANGNPLPSEDGIVEKPVQAPKKPIMPDEGYGALFLALNAEDRATSAALKNAVVGIYDREGTLASSYAPGGGYGAVEGIVRLAETARAETPQAQAARQAIEALQRCLDKAEPATATFTLSGPGGDRVIEVCAYPAKDASGNLATAVVVFQDITGGLSLTERQNRMEPGASSRWVTSFFEYRKNVDAGPRWRSNNAGFRDDDIALPKPPNLFRIACVGGSTTEEGRINDLTYPNILQKLLNETFKGSPQMDVVNCGVVGLDSSGERKRTLDYMALSPDLVVEYNGVNDICHSMLARWRDETSPFAKFLRHSWVLDRFASRLFMPPRERIERTFEQVSIANLRAMHDVLARHGIAMAVCSFAAPAYGALRAEERDYFDWDFKTNWQGYYFSLADYCALVDTYNRLVKRFCEEQHVLYIPVAEELIGGADLFGDICHLRPKGIQRKAEIIAKHLEPYIHERLQTTATESSEKAPNS